MFHPDLPKLSWWQRLVIKWRFFWFLRRGFTLPKIEAPLPKLTLNELANVQPIDPKLGKILLGDK